MNPAIAACWPVGNVEQVWYSKDLYQLAEQRPSRAGGVLDFDRKVKSDSMTLRKTWAAAGKPPATSP